MSSDVQLDVEQASSARLIQQQIDLVAQAGGGRVVLPAMELTLDRAPSPGTALGLYVHIPFCRKRCRFCYFKVVTEKNAREVDEYVEAVLAEAALLASRGFVGGRPLRFVYFGGGTPSFLSTGALERLVLGLRERVSWAPDAEFTFECEPGTVTPAKLQAIRELGVTRLSVGVESFDDELLSINGRAHGARHVDACMSAAQALGFARDRRDRVDDRADAEKSAFHSTRDGTRIGHVIAGIRAGIDARQDEIRR